jgi:hypothetical protein
MDRGRGFRESRSGDGERSRDQGRGQDDPGDAPTDDGHASTEHDLTVATAGLRAG